MLAAHCCEVKYDVSRPKQGTQGDVALQERIQTKRPELFRVLLHNDHYTTMDFVIEILATVFAKPIEEAVSVMLAVHEKGVGVAGIYPASVAETKISAVHARAQEEGFPLRCSMEPE